MEFQRKIRALTRNFTEHYSMVTLREDFDAYIRGGFISRATPVYITENLNHSFNLRPYQTEAIARFIHYYEKYPQRLRPTQLLFHMATGSGKTLLMAANILYLYKQGYRNFLFFVNSTNIIEKTRDNFLNKLSSKYLFNEKIVIDGKQIQINEVPNFEIIDPNGINLFFTTVQGLHSLMNYSRENTITYEDLKDKKIVIISDEAHHINAWTKKGLSKEEESEKETWEQTITELFNVNSENIMLEYTATIDLDEPAIKEKYALKIIYEYTLKEFRLDGFSKEVKVLQADLEDMDRALQSVIISQYRRKIAESNRKSIKPVILMKSRTIDESKIFKERFSEKIKNLKVKDLSNLKDRVIEDNVLKKAFKFFDREKIPLSNLVQEINEDFSEDKCLLFDSNNITSEKQLLANSLEDKNNQIRIIFAVNMLNEGWDVLNLFDIVRLYNTRDAKQNRPGKTTIAEAQLIGRGARYCPFQINDEQDKYKRKYDNETDNDLRVLEELYYHSAHNPKYIQEITHVLRETGILPATEPKRIEIKVKEDFKKTNFWNKGLLFSNEKVKRDISKIKDLEDTEITKLYKYSLMTGQTQSITVFEEDVKNKAKERVTTTLNFFDLEKCVLRKALNKVDFYKFENLKLFFPAINSISRFLASTSEIKVEISSTIEAIGSLSKNDKLKIAIFVFEKIKEEVEKTHNEFGGSKEFKAKKIKDLVSDKVINVAVNDNLMSDQERGIPMKEARNEELRIDLSNQKWYVYDENYGTSEEKYLIKFIKDNMHLLEERYDEIFFVRNEKIFKIHRFSDGKVTEPDFVLFLKEKTRKKVIAYQIFIEAKGEHLLSDDKWKEDFLKEIESNYKVSVLADNTQFKIIGLPFYNENKKFEFANEFNKKFKLVVNEQAQ